MRAWQGGGSVMHVRRKRYQEGGRFFSVFRVELEPDELAALNSAGLGSFKIQRHAGAITGNSFTALSVANAFQAQVNRLRNRWSVALARTTGYIFFDVVLFYLRLIRDVVLFFLKVLFGKRQSFADLLVGVKYSAKRVEDLKEIETFVLVSIAAVHEALRYAMDLERDDLFEDNAYREEIPGLTFAGSLAVSEAGAAGDLNTNLSDLSGMLDEDAATEETLDAGAIGDVVGALADGM